MKTYQKFLVDKLTERKKKNPQFSLRSFAKVLGMSPSQLSALINGRKSLTPKQASKIINGFSLSEQEASDLLHDMIPNVSKIKFQLPDMQMLSTDEFNLISDWYHFAILSLGRLKENRANAKWISHKLGIDPLVALEAMQRLERMGLIEIKDGQFKQSTKPLVTTTDIPSTAIRSYHRQNLGLALDKLELVPVEERVFSTITMATTLDRLEKAKKMISEFKQKLCRELECENPEEVYTLSMQLFPVTK